MLVMKELTQELEVHRGGGWGGELGGLLPSFHLSARVGWAPAALTLQGWGQRCGSQWSHVPSQ